MPSLIGNKANQVPTNGDLGTMAFREQDQFYSSQQTMGFKNRIINGAMMIDQRNAGASVTPTTDATYTLDRWAARLGQASKYSVQQNAGSVTPPAGFTNYLGVTSLSAYSLLVSDYFAIQQGIEGLNLADLGWGTANAQTVALSFWVRSSLTGTFSGALQNRLSNRTYPFTYTVNAANTWEYKTATIAGDTSGTWDTDNRGGVYLYFSLGMGSNRSGTANAWNAGNTLGVSGATSVVGTNGATFYITGVQLEKGSTATSFDYRPYGTELALCQRYFQRTNTNNDCTILSMYATSGQLAYRSFALNPTMRAAPTVTLSDHANSGFNNSTVNTTDTSFFRSDSLANMTTANGYIRFLYSASAEL